MADLPPTASTGEDTGEGPDREATTGISRWQKVVGIIGLVVLLGVGIRLFGAVGGGQGPGGHGPGGDTPPAAGTQDEGQAPPREGGHTPPFDHG